MYKCIKDVVIGNVGSFKYGDKINFSVWDSLYYKEQKYFLKQ